MIKIVKYLIINESMYYETSWSSEAIERETVLDSKLQIYPLLPDEFHRVIKTIVESLVSNNFVGSINVVQSPKSRNDK